MEDCGDTCVARPTCDRLGACILGETVQTWDQVFVESDRIEAAEANAPKL
jgi:hypothetical protein